MKTLKLTLLIVSLGALSLWGYMKLNPAYCLWCPTYTCYGPCVKGCLCVTVGPSPGGQCVGVEHSEALKAHGYRVIP